MLVCHICGGTRSSFPHKCKVSRITYWIRVSDSAYMESSPKEIQGFMDKGFVPDIRIMAERTSK